MRSDENLNNDNKFELIVEETFKSDVAIFGIGMLSGGLFGVTVSAGSLIAGINILSEKYLKNATFLNNILFCIYFIFAVGVHTHILSYKVIASCEIGYNLQKSICNMDIDTKRAVLLSFSVNLLFTYSKFGILVILFNCIYRTLEHHTCDDIVHKLYDKAYAYDIVKKAAKYLHLGHECSRH